MVKENHKLISQNERIIDGQTLSKINIGKLRIAININGHKGNVSIDKKKLALTQKINHPSKQMGYQ